MALSAPALASTHIFLLSATLDSSPSFHSLSLSFASGRPFLRFQSAAALYDFRSYSSSLSTMMRSPISFFLVAFLALMAGKGSWPLLPRA